MKTIFTFLATLFLFTSFSLTVGCMDSNDNGGCQCEECSCEDACSCVVECSCPNCVT